MLVLLKLVFMIPDVNCLMCLSVLQYFFLFMLSNYRFCQALTVLSSLESLLVLCPKNLKCHSITMLELENIRSCIDMQTHAVSSSTQP